MFVGMGDRFDVSVVPILDKLPKNMDKSGQGWHGFESMHGRMEVRSDAWELCAQKHYPKRLPGRKVPQWLEFVECLDKDFAGETAPQARSCAAQAGIEYIVINECSTKQEEGLAFLAKAVASTSGKISSAPTYDIGRDRFDGVKNATGFLQLACPALVCLDEYFKPAAGSTIKHHVHRHGSRRLADVTEDAKQTPSACSRRLVSKVPVDSQNTPRSTSALLVQSGATVLSSVHSAADSVAVYGWIVVLAFMVSGVCAAQLMLGQFSFSALRRYMFIQIDPLLLQRGRTLPSSKLRAAVYISTIMVGGFGQPHCCWMCHAQLKTLTQILTHDAFVAADMEHDA
jgi:hypothetical protein